MKRLSGLVLAALLACGPSPEASSPGGTLVVVVRQGDERVPFRPEIARIKAANEQLARLLGHPIAIEVDGALLPQTHEAAGEVLAGIVEQTVRDVNDVAVASRGHGVRDAMTYTRAHFRRLVLRYDPGNAALRIDSFGRFPRPVFDVPTGTIDFALGRATSDAIASHAITNVLVGACEAEQVARYRGKLPNDLPANERRVWFELEKDRRPERSEGDAGVNTFAVRGALQLVRGPDAELARYARAWLFDKALEEFHDAYQHHVETVETFPPGSRFRTAEREYVAWLDEQLPSASLAERGAVASKIWITDWRKHGDLDYYAPAFPGLDKMSFAFTTVDLWIAAGHPLEPASFVNLIAPQELRPVNGTLQLKTLDSTRSALDLYRWLLSDRDRTEALARGMLARGDTPFTIAAFGAAKSIFVDDGRYMRFLAHFEGAPDAWLVGAEILRQDRARELSGPLFEEAKRLWRDVPMARGYAFFWLAAGVPHRDDRSTAGDWKEALGGRPVTPADYGAFLDIGAESFEKVVDAWPALPRGHRIRPLLDRVPTLLRNGGNPSALSSTLGEVAHQLCIEPGGAAEAAELHAWAVVEQPKRPGVGLADVVERSACKGRGRQK